jgi:large subunit ribosomal protein L15
VPKLRGFKRRGRIEYQVVNVGRLADYAAAGRLGEPADAPLTVNAEVLAAAGLIRHAERPVKVLGEGEVEVKLFVAADAFTASARAKIEAAGGFVQLLTPAAATTLDTSGAPEPSSQAAPATALDGVSDASDSAEATE